MVVTWATPHPLCIIEFTDQGKYMHSFLNITAVENSVGSKDPFDTTIPTS